MNNRGSSSSDHYDILDKMLNAFALHEIICDERGNPIDYRFLKVNPAFEALTGLKKENVLNKRVLEILPDTERYWIETYGEIATSGVSKRFQNYSQELDRYFDVFAFSPEKGKFACLFNDITELKLHEDELQKYKILFDNANIGLAILDETGKLLLVNEYLANIHGYSREEATGRHLSIFHNEDQLESAEELRALGFNKGYFKTVELYHHKKTGENFPMLMNGMLIESADKNKQLAVTALDITEQKLTMMQAEEHKNKLMQADKMASLGILVAGVAHEINNPNNSIMLNIPILQNLLECALPFLDKKQKNEGDFKVGKIPYSAIRPEIQSLLGGIIESSSRIKNIVNDLKDYAKDSSESEFEPLKLNNVINSSLTLLKSMLKKLAKSIDCKLAPDLPTLNGSFQKLEQVVVNLIQNACESKNGEKVNLEIISFYDEEKKAVCVTIKDDGCGIPETKLKYIHDPFFTTKRSNGGTGLGLSVSMGILKECGGEMFVDSAEGRGSKFTISIPLK